MKNKTFYALHRILIISFASFLLLGASSSSRLRFLKNTDLPDTGLRVKIMPDSTETPFPPPSIRGQLPSEDGGRIDLYMIADLWRQNQHAGQWIDEDGNVLLLATMKKLPPVNASRPVVSYEEFSELIETAENIPLELDNEKLIKWVSAYIGEENVTAQAAGKLPRNLAGLLKFNASSYEQKKRSLIYAFRINTTSLSMRNAPPDWFLAIFTLAPSVDLADAQKSIGQNFFPALAAAPATSRISTSPGGITRPDTSDSEKSDEFKESRDQVKNSIKNMQDWWFSETDNYIILSNLKRKSQVSSIEKQMELIRGAYEQFMPPKKEITAVSVIRVFNTPEEYLQFVGPELQWSAGVWMSGKKEMVIRPVEWGKKKDQEEQMMQTIYHEGFHQYVFYAMDQKHTSAWFNEGHACFYENSQVSRSHLIVEEDPHRSEVITEMAEKNRIDVKKMLHMSYQEFYGANKTENYSLAWGMVYYLMKYAPKDKDQKYVKILEKYGDALWESGDPDQATDDAFAEIDIDQFKEDFTEFWLSRTKRNSASKNRIFKEYQGTSIR